MGRLGSGFVAGSAVCATLLLAGCAAQVEAIPGPVNGQTQFVLKCGSGISALSKCARAANTQCPDGYTVLERQSQLVPTTIGLVSAQSWLIECKAKP